MDGPAPTPAGEDRPPPKFERKNDLIGIFVRHKTAANLLMMIMILAGFVALQRMPNPFFPDFGIDVISVTVKWPGASASDVDGNIVQAIEPEVRFIDGVKDVKSTSTEGVAVIIIEFRTGSDMQAALSNVETAVGQITTLPEASEKPVIQKIIRYEPLSRILITGPYSEASLKQVAKRFRDELLREGIDKVDMVGMRDEEILVEISPEALRRLDLTLEEVAAKIRSVSQDVPSGDLSGRATRQLRSLGLVKTARDMGRIEIKSLPNGQKIYLSDIAKVSETFAEDDKINLYRGRRAIELVPMRTINGDALQLADKVDAYLAKLRPTLSKNLTVIQFDRTADLIRSRINLLLENGVGGLILVLIVLFLFLNLKVAFWVAVGIPVSLMATLLVMWMGDQTINMVSLFGLIMAIGIIVDDAIVVGEHSEALKRRGLGAMDAAELGARRMAAPVFSSSLTTVAAFLPLLIISGYIGAIIEAIPLVIIAVIIASLVECFLVLPGHMREALAETPYREARGLLHRGYAAFRSGFDKGFGYFRDRPFRAAVDFAVRWRYATIALALATFIVCLGLVAGGRVGFVFFPNPEVDKVFANVQFTAGSPRERTVEMLNELDRALRQTERELTDGKGGLIRMAIGRVGQAVGEISFDVKMEGDHVGGMTLELVSTDERSVTASTFVAAWRRNVRMLPGMESLTIKPALGGPPGADVDVRLTGRDPEELKAAAMEVRRLIRKIPGASDVEDDFPYGKQEMILELTPRGRALGFTTANVGEQVRNAFEGAIAKRFARGDEEVLVRVRHPKRALDLETLGRFYLRAPNGSFVPLSTVVRIREQVGFARIKRENGVRQVAVTAKLEQTVTSTSAAIATLERDGLREIARKYGVRYHFKGKAEEQAETFGDMITGSLVGLAIIYIVLAWVFSSYARPFAVMAIIPLGFVGTTVGHLLLGFDLTILSMIALVGLSGIVVNDSIILVTTIAERLEAGEGHHEAIVGGSQDRLRAVMLTSLTTIGGLTPLLFETSLQAQFLIPMAITMVFGLAYATFLVLFVIPSLMAILHDFGRLFRRRRTGAIQAH